MGIRGLKPKPEVVLIVLIIADVVGIALGCLWVYAGDDSIEAIYTRRPHQGRAVRAVALSPNGRLAASGADDGTVQVWDIGSSRGVARFAPGRGLSVLHVLFTPDSRRILAGCQNGTLTLWDARTGRKIRQFIGHRGSVLAMAISPDGKQVSSSDGRSDRLLLHDLATARLLKAPLKPGFRVSALAFSPNGRRLLAAGLGGAARLWDMDDYRETPVSPSAYGGATTSSVDFDPSGTTFIWCNDNSDVGLVDASTGRQLGRWRLDWTDRPRAVRFTRDGRYVLVATGTGRGLGRSAAANAIHLRDARTFRLKRLLVGHTDKVNCLAVSRRGSRIISGSEDGTVRVWKLP